MGASSSIQFRGKEQVLTAYQSRGVDVWSIFQGKTLLTKGTGINELDQYLQMVDKAESQAIYILKVYEEISDPIKVKEKTEADGSFYFRLQEPEEYEYKRRGFMQDYERRLNEQGETLALILQKLEREPEDDEPAGIGSIITGILSDPEKLEKTIGVVQRLLGMNSQPVYGQIGNVNILDSTANSSLSPSFIPTSPTMQQQQQQQPMNEQEKLTRLAAAIDTLEKCDTELIPHLEKLAKIASQNPAQFKTLIGMLDVF